MADIKRIGYGQVEPNHLSAKRTGQIYAQLPVDADTLGTVLENGRFVKYDYANKKVNLTGAGEWMLVYNEIKLYDERKQMYRDYAMKAEEQVNGEMVPRVFKTNVGDIYTTNCIGDGTSAVTVTVGANLKVGADGYLTTGTDSAFQWQVVDIYTMPDGQPGIKIMRVK